MWTRTPSKSDRGASGDASGRVDAKSPKWILVRALVAVVILVAVAEASLRIVLGLGAPVLFQMDPRFGAFPQPNQRLHRFFVDVRTNQYGMRSAPIPNTKTPGEFRILFVGDSVSYGTTYVNQREIMVEQVESRLRERHVSVVAMNASCPGWAPSNELAFIRARGIFDADLVVLVYNTKDLTQGFAQFRSSPNTPTRNPTFAIEELWTRYISVRLPGGSPLVDPGSTASQGKPLEQEEMGVLATIEQTRRLVIGQGTKLVVLFSPAYTDDVRKYEADWNAGVGRLRKWASESGVPLLDMTPLVQRYSVRQLYYDGIHLKPLGDKLFADAFVDWFVANPQLLGLGPIEK